MKLQLSSLMVAGVSAQFATMYQPVQQPLQAYNLVRPSGFGYAATAPRFATAPVMVAAAPAQTAAGPSDSLQNMMKKSTAKMISYALSYGDDELADTNGLDAFADINYIQYAQTEADKAAKALEKARADGVTGAKLREAELKAQSKQGALMEEMGKTLLGQSSSGFTMAGLAKNQDKAAAAEIAKMKLDATIEKARKGEADAQTVSLAESAYYTAEQKRMAQVYAMTGNSRMGDISNYLANQASAQSGAYGVQKAEQKYYAEPSADNQRAVEVARLKQQSAALAEQQYLLLLMGNKQMSKLAELQSLFKKNQAQQLSDEFYPTGGMGYGMGGGLIGSDPTLMYSMILGGEGGMFENLNIFGGGNSNLLMYALMGGL